MRVIKIGVDPFLKKDVKKIEYATPPTVKIFNASDVATGNLFSNLAIAFIYTWKKDKPPKKVRELFSRISNYSAIIGYWRTTNGAKYVFSNILSNPNINKLLIFVFDAEDNGHLLVDALVNFWTKGVNKENVIKGTKTANPKFEGLSIEALKRLKKQTDLLVCKNITRFDIVEEVVKAALQEPENATDVKSLKVDFYSSIIKNGKLYDDGCRFEKPFKVASSLEKIERISCQTKPKAIGGSVCSKDLKDAFQKLVSFITRHGEQVLDQRGIKTKECRSLTIIITNPLKNIPQGFSKDYLGRYVKEFLEGTSSEKFSYTYHNRIFKKWGNQKIKIIQALRKSGNTRRALISLWDPSSDISDANSPCLNFIWAVIRNKKLELHALYRSHHIATTTEKGELLVGEGAFVPNAYALAVMQSKIAEELNLKTGSLVVTDLSSHVYISETK